MVFSESYKAAMEVYVGLNLFIGIGIVILFSRLVGYSKRLESKIDDLFDELDD